MQGDAINPLSVFISTNSILDQYFQVFHSLNLKVYSILLHFFDPFAFGKKLGKKSEMNI